jgi:hypothetical protein
LKGVKVYTAKNRLLRIELLNALHKGDEGQIPGKDAKDLSFIKGMKDKTR